MVSQLAHLRGTRNRSSQETAAATADFEIVFLKNDFEIVLLKNDFEIVLQKSFFKYDFEIVFEKSCFRNRVFETLGAP